MLKKGFLKTKVMQFMLIAMIIVVFLAVGQQFSEVYFDTSTSEKCRLSVERNARYHIAGLELGSEIDCPTRKIEIEGSNQNAARKEVADAMYTCWKQFGKGELNLFEGEGVFCNVCYLIDVKTEEPITDLGNYLMSTPSPSENLYYFDYLGSFKSSQADRVLGALAETDLDDVRLDMAELSNVDGENKYAIIFVYAKGKDNMEKLVKQVTLKSTEGKVITPIATGTAVFAGVGAGFGAAALIAGAPVTVPIAIGAGAAVGTFAAVEYVGSLFSSDTPPEWIAFNVLRVWNPDETPQILSDELGCRTFVEAESI